MTKEEEIAKIFKAVCDPIRISIIQILKKDEKCACELMKILEIAQSKLSYHMKILCESGIIESWSVGKWTHYKLSKSGAKHARQLFKELTK